MIDLETIKQAARSAFDERGDPVIQIPLSLWEAWLARLESELPQPETFKTLFDVLYPDRALPDTVADLRKFVQEQFLSFHEHDLGLTDDWPSNA